MNLKFLRIKDGNWGLKLLALVLALVIYHTLKNKTETHPQDNDRTLFHAR